MKALKRCLTGGILLMLLLMAACSNGESLDKETKLQMVDKVKKLEAYEYDLYFFSIDYNEYLDLVKGIASEAYLNSVSDRIIFGYNEVEYTSKELIGMPREEWNKHKAHMLRTIRHLELDGQVETIQVSEPYIGDQEDQAFIYTSGLREVKGQRFIKAHKKYTLRRIQDQWLITSVESDRYTFGGDQTEEEVQSQLAKLQYQTHGDQPVQYLEDTLVLQGVGEE